MKEKIKEYIDYLIKERNLSDNTIRNYQIDLTNYAEYVVINSLDYLKISKDDVREYLKYLDKIDLQNKSISRHLSALRSFYDYLVEYKNLEVNIFKLTKSPKWEQTLPNYLDYEDMQKLLDVFDLTKPKDVRNKFIIELLYSTGVRVGELVGIKVSDVDLEDQSILVFGKGSKQRIVYFGDYARELYDTYIRLRPKMLKGKQSEYLFINTKGEALTVDGISYVIRKVVKMAAIKNDVTPHTFRHTFATHMLNEGADIKTVQELLGHKSLSTTGIYTHVSNERLRSVYLETHPKSRKADDNNG